MKKEIRAFYAIELATEVKQAIIKLSLGLQQASKHSGIRWTKEENLHITLRFLGNINTDTLEQINQELSANADKFTTFTINFPQLMFFPSKHKPHTLALNIKPYAPLIKLVTDLGSILSHHEIKPESRPYRAHLTIARNRDHKIIQLPTALTKPIPSQVVNEFVLYQSKPTEKGSEYIVLERFKLTTQ